MPTQHFRLDGKTIAMTGAAGILGQGAVAAFLGAGALLYRRTTPAPAAA